MSEEVARTLVSRLAQKDWMVAFQALEEMGEGALPAIREGLRHPDWRVRRWSLLFLDHHWDAESLESVIPLLHDPKKEVRLWAAHALACEACKDGCRPVDPLPYLVERLEQDPSIRVRRHAMALLAAVEVDARCVPVFERILAEESDAKMRKHAEWGLKRCREAGLV